VTLSVVLPVWDCADLVGPAVRSLAAAVAPAGGQVLVVDDASTDATAARAEEAGATVLRRAERGGPYAARNQGWAEADHPVVVFVDARCRPRPGWVEALTPPFADPDVAVVGGDVRVSSGSSLATRTAHHLQPLRLAAPADAPFLPYAPTCHLAVRRTALEAVGGFAEVRGGGDVDLCWAVQHLGVGGFRAAPDAVLDWEPRPSIASLRAQYRRYGHNHGRLCTAWAAAGCPRPPTAPPWRTALHHLRDRHDARPPVAVVAAACHAAYASGLRRGLAEPDPRLGPDREVRA